MSQSIVPTSIISWSIVVYQYELNTVVCLTRVKEPVQLTNSLLYYWVEELFISPNDS